VAGGDEKSLEQNRKAMLDYVKSEYKIDAKKLCDILGIKGVNEITTEIIADVRGRITAIKEGDATVETAFPMPGEPTKPGTAGLKEKLTKPTAKPAEVVNQDTGEVTEGDAKEPPVEQPAAEGSPNDPGDALGPDWA
jgi:hypothetical protein